MRLHRAISNNAKFLTNMEKELLQNLLENKSYFNYKNFTIQNVSEKFAVSNTSIHRMSKKLGYNSFLNFKDDYFSKIEEEENIKEKDNTFINMMIDTYNLVTQSNYDQVIDKMLNCKKITIYGMGMSNYLGKIFQIKLQLLGIPAEQHDDSRFMRLSSRILNKGEDLVFILSRSGETPELLEVLVEANLRGIDVVLITESRGSTFEKMATHIIYTAYTKDSDNDIDTRLNFHIAMDMVIKEFLEKYKRRN
ncbi:MAG: MurR/RpiR family transcriptional regulator [Clostridium sp.]